MCELENSMVINPYDNNPWEFDDNDQYGSSTDEQEEYEYTMEDY